MSATPLIDSRTGEQIVEQGKALAAEYTPDWIPREGDRGQAMLSLFGRLMEIVISRLNRVPEKNFLAFLDTAGITLQPPKAARAPMKFLAVEGAPDDGIVAAGTQIATAPPSGQRPVTFETEKSLVVHRSRLQHLFTYDPAGDKYADLSGILGANEKNVSLPFQPFVGTTLVPHRLYLAQDMLLRLGHSTTVRLEVTLSSWAPTYESLFRQRLTWKIWAAGEEKDITPRAGFGDISFDITAKKVLINFTATQITQIDQTARAGEQQMRAWIWGETSESLTPLDATLEIVSVSISTEAREIAPAAALFNTSTLDLSREFYPFGERPKLFDAFFLAVPEAFARKGSTVTIIPKFQAGASTLATGITLTWDFWDGTVWRQLGASNSVTAPAAGTWAFTDTTMALTEASTGLAAPTKIEFTCPDMAVVDLHGKKNYWLRARITGGNYGEEAKMELTTAGIAKLPQDRRLSDWTYFPPSYQPPIILSVAIAYRYATGLRPTDTRTENNFAVRSIDPTQAFQPFAMPREDQPAWYLGFGRAFAAKPVSLFLAVQESAFATPPTVVWEYLSSTGWKSLGVQDGTANLTQSGMLEFIGPSDASASALFGVASQDYWIRARLEAGEKRGITLLGAYLNATWARQCATVHNELLGSSTENPDAEFTLARAPILEGLKIEVREPDRPSEEDLVTLRDEEQGEEVLQPVEQAQSPSRECWVRWHRVDHFRLSGKRSRHYTCDWATGKIRFGNGLHGMVPPAGRENVRAAMYQAGGGTKAAVGRNAITALKRSIPFVEKAFNVDRAGGGSDIETTAAVMLRGPQTIKNRDRAVTREDYEWLAKEASFEVARARCLPAKTIEDAGTVRLIIVPMSDELRPSPSQGLIGQVKEYLNTRARRLGTANLVVLGPKYVEVSVHANVFPERLEETDLVRRRVREKLTTFFHPLLGGPDKTGWDFGRGVYVSEVCKEIEDTQGVHHAERVLLSSADLSLSAVSFIPVSEDSIVATGEHSVTMSIMAPASYLGNVRSHELHDLGRTMPQCQLERIDSSHRVFFQTIVDAQRQGYDLCGWCFGPGASTR